MCPGITDSSPRPGLINLDFADVKSVMPVAGSALMGIGSARGDDRSVVAAEQAIASPLLEASHRRAHGVLLSIAGGSDLGLFEINEAARLVAEAAHDEANIIFGAVIDDALGDEVRVTVIAAGFDGGHAAPSRARLPARPSSRTGRWRQPARGPSARLLTAVRSGGAARVDRARVHRLRRALPVRHSSSFDRGPRPPGGVPRAGLEATPEQAHHQRCLR